MQVYKDYRVEVEDAVIVSMKKSKVGTLSFRDFGTGMSPEIITSTYVIY